MRMEVRDIVEYATKWGLPLPDEDQGSASPDIVGIEGAILYSVVNR